MPFRRSRISRRPGAYVARWSAEQADIHDLSALRSVAARYRPFDVLALMAGIKAFKPIIEINDENWEDQLAVNLTGTANCLRALRARNAQARTRPRNRDLIYPKEGRTELPTRHRNAVCSAS
jgi:NAD(P)-dependent dehydrogenase (short-subunit alcohol dehydrogenase family)